MAITIENLLFIGSILIFSSILISKAGGRFGLPTLLVFLGVGMLFGTDGLGIQFDSMKVAQMIGTVALCVILFTGGIETKFEDIRPVLGPGLVLSTLGVVLTTVMTGVFLFYLSQWMPFMSAIPLVTCLLLAATMSSTDSASVFNILRSKKMHLKNNLQPTLELESGSNDPMAYVLTIVLIGICTATQSAEGTFETAVVIKDALLTLGQQFLVGILGGVAMGYAAVWVTNKIDLNNPALYAVLMVCVMFFTFSFTGMLGGNGYLAIYLTGIIIGNKPLAKRKHIFAFLDTLTWFMQIAMFLSLGLLVNPTEMLRVWPIGILVGVFMIVLARPLSVFLCLIPFKNIRTKSKHFISWVGLRGAVPIIFATYPVVAGIEGSDIIFNVVFFITLLSLIIQGSTIPFIAEKLDLIGEAPEEENQFGIEVPEDVGQLTEITLTKDSLEHGNTLKELQLPKGMLVVSIKRSGKFLVPNGTRELLPGDRLLIISEAEV